MKIIYLEMSDLYNLDELGNFTKLDYEKVRISEYLENFDDNIILISAIEAGVFKLSNTYVPLSLIDFVVSIARKKQFPIRWRIEHNLLFSHKNIIYIFKKEPFWKFIANHDELIINWRELDIILLYEELLQLIQGIQLDCIKFVANCKFEKEEQKELFTEILETIKQVTLAKIFYGGQEI
jgi:hypothetical protein